MTFKADKIWMDGKLIPWKDAKIHVLSHVVHYGTGAFEGIRAYEIAETAHIFRFEEHIKRLMDSCKIYRMEPPYSIDEIKTAVRDTIKANNLKSCYIRPLIFRGFGELGINPFKCPIHTMIAVWNWGTYLGEESLKKGIHACTSSWNRAATNTFPTLAKICGNYINSQLIKIEALNNGFSEGIALTPEGFVSEGSGENLFIIKDDKIYTPGLGNSILPGITRDSVIRLLTEKGFSITEGNLPRELLYLADEVFMTGTAAEITPVSQIDHYKIGNGKRGSITEEVQSQFFDIIQGRKADIYNWLTKI